MRRWVGFFGFLVSLLGAPALAADLVVAQVSPLSGPLGRSGQDHFTGAKVYFDQVNEQAGGVSGRRLRFLSEDDQYKPEETVRLVKLVAQRDRPALFVNLFGSANVVAVLKDKTLDRVRVPVFGVTPGSESLRSPGSPWLFHVTAGDREQVRHVVRHLSTIGLTRLALVFQDNPFGKNGLALAREFARDAGVTVAGEYAVPVGADDLKPVASRLREAGAQAYLMVLATNSAASFVRDVRALGDATPTYGLSYASIGDVLGKTPLEQAAGVALAQISPNIFSQNTAVVREFQATLKRYAPEVKEPTQQHFLGYLSARVAVEALRKAGADASPEALAAAARALRADLGGYQIDFKGGNVGSTYVNIGVIGRSGRLVY